MQSPRTIWVVLLVAWALAGGTVRAQSPLAVYTDSLVNGWESWGWATLDLAATNARTGSRSIGVTVGAWEALYLQHAAFDSTLYSNLTFWVNGGPAGGQRLQVRALLSGVEQPAVALAALPTNAWRQHTLSLAALGVANRPDLDGFWIQDTRGRSQPTFYVDDIELTAAPPPALVRVSVNATQALRTVEARWFGLNAAVWDADFDTSQTVGLLNEMGNQVLRFPGGSLSDEYHWGADTSGTNTWKWTTSFTKFAHVATNTRAQVFITVNYGTGTPQEAAAWVRHSNVTNRYGFKYWEIGNENYGTWEADTNRFPHDAYTYATRASNYLARMKEADPSIKVGVVVVPGESSYINGYTNHPAVNLRTGATNHGWTPVLLTTLRTLGVQPDFAIHHRYPQNPGGESDATLLQSSASWASDAANLRQQLSDYLGPAATNVELVCTENNSVSSQPGKQTTSLVNALFLADSFGQMAKTEFNALVWWDLRNGISSNYNDSPALYGWRNYGDYGVVQGRTNRYPAYYAAKLLQHFARGDDQVLSASTDFPLLAVYAARRTNGAVTLLVINKDPTANLNAQVTLQGFTPAAEGTVHSYAIPQDEAARTGLGSPDIALAQLSGVAGSFTHSFPPYSISVLTLAPAPARLRTDPGAWLPDGRFRFVLEGQSGVRYVVLASTNLASWTALVTNRLTSSSLTITDAPPTGVSRRFYRAGWLP
jgi:hypothetical protein